MLAKEQHLYISKGEEENVTSTTNRCGGILTLSPLLKSNQQDGAVLVRPLP
jgi:hypothetical protein